MNKVFQITVKIEKDFFNRDTIYEGHRKIYENWQQINWEKKEEPAGDIERGIVCKVHPIRFADIIRWPPDDLKLCEWIPMTDQRRLPKVKMEKLATTVIGACNIQKDDAIFEIYF
jgi:hypothetical protein